MRDLQKQHKALVAELERLQRVKDARIAQLEQVSSCPLHPVAAPFCDVLRLLYCCLQLCGCVKFLYAMIYLFRNHHKVVM